MNEEENEDHDAEAKASYTRQRRLSHVRTAVHKEAEEALDEDLGKAKLDKLETVDLKECVDEGPPQTDLLIACATRAGDEPGYRKTNQDAYTVHEKFASTAGSFFAVFDGHGPNGEDENPTVSSTQQPPRGSTRLFLLLPEINTGS